MIFGWPLLPATWIGTALQWSYIGHHPARRGRMLTVSSVLAGVLLFLIGPTEQGREIIWKIGMASAGITTALMSGWLALHLRRAAVAADLQEDGSQPPASSDTANG